MEQTDKKKYHTFVNVNQRTVIKGSPPPPVYCEHVLTGLNRLG